MSMMFVIVAHIACGAKVHQSSMVLSNDKAFWMDDEEDLRDMLNLDLGYRSYPGGDARATSHSSYLVRLVLHTSERITVKTVTTNKVGCFFE